MVDLIRGFDIVESLKYMLSYFLPLQPLDIIKALIDISIVTFIIYELMIIIKETRAKQLIKGLFVIIGVAYLSGLLGLSALSFILNSALQLMGLALVVLFHPELRRILEQLGRRNFSDIFKLDDNHNYAIATRIVMDELVDAVFGLSKKYTGALIIIERKTKVGDIITTGIEVDSLLTSEFIRNIFIPNTPLHDGAMIIRNNRIKAAGCILPLTENKDLDKELGTRHKAALGISEISDALSIVVSEETGNVSFAKDGVLTRNLDSAGLRKLISENLLEEGEINKKISLLRGKIK